MKTQHPGEHVRILALRETAPLLIAFGVDMLGEPSPAIHPVVWYGKLIRALESRAPRTPRAQLLYGLCMPLLAAPAALLPAYLIEMGGRELRTLVRRRGYPLAGEVLSALLKGGSLKPFFALRMLVLAGRSIRHALERHDLPAARLALLHLVSRDRSDLSEELVAAAAIESLAENVSDSVVAPVFYYLLWGLPGAAAYRLFNTFDSMIGYHGHYEYLGKAAARLDDILNLLPSRLTALLIIALAPLFGGNRRSAYRIWRRDAGKTESPNAGHPMAAAAGAFEIQLEKVNFYRLGDASTRITPAHIRQAERMVQWVGGSMFLLAALVKICLRFRR
ncbi:cobalamin biosynthesis protein CobD [Dictyobacter sp. S3.2.2.5]|uniref:Cobalamin biosynthesis protein CobD n=2 Tax=Dictyobacter halimunensis TaxID=3026934 RepID=A0ABQ6FNY1_9CHLR|nr:cobalamin biosynthesis protein CobD [Dictyobacter sp. S3.2.2.5]